MIHSLILENFMNLCWLQLLQISIIKSNAITFQLCEQKHVRWEIWPIYFHYENSISHWDFCIHFKDMHSPRRHGYDACLSDVTSKQLCHHWKTQTLTSVLSHHCYARTLFPVFCAHMFFFLFFSLHIVVSYFSDLFLGESVNGSSRLAKF